MKKLMKKENGKMKSVKVRTSLLFAFSFLLFTSAATAADLPVGYMAVSYIESTNGGGQYIDTGIKSSPTLTATMDYMAFAHTGDVNLGTVKDNDANWRYFDYAGGPLFDYERARAGQASGNTLELNIRYIVNIGSEGDNIYLAVTNAQTQTEVKSFTAVKQGSPRPENVFVFGGWSSGAIVCTPMRLYSLTLRDFANAGDAERTTLAEFVPCVRTSDGAIGLYDLVGGRFVENAGAGIFVSAEDDIYATVAVPEHNHVIASWTSGNWSLTNRIDGASFRVLKGLPFKVLFAPEHGLCELEGSVLYESSGVSGNVALAESEVPVARMPSVEYVDADGLVKSCADYGIVTNVTSELKSGWYVVAGRVSRGTITVNGDVHLILMDDCDLTAASGERLAGIAVESGNSLAIYGQRNGTGKLTATGGRYAAGIGGQNPNWWKGYGNCGSITINGGVVTAQGNDGGAGIGGANQGAGGTVTINGGRIRAQGSSAPEIGAGYKGAGGAVKISGGLFSWKPNEGWLIDPEHLGILSNADAATCNDYPWIVARMQCVTIDRELVHMTAAWTSGDGTVTNAIDGTSFRVLKGTTGVSVIFTPKSFYRFASAGETGVRTPDSPLDGDCVVTPPTLEAMPGAVDNPWGVGTDARAYVNDEGALVIEGTGATDDFASAADVPWAAIADEVTAVLVANGVILGKNILAVMSDSVPVSATVSIGSIRNALGVTAQPSGAISPAEFEQVQIVDGKAYLGVSVATNAVLEVEKAGGGGEWGRAEIEGATLEDDGTVTLTVPATAEKGFMILKSKGK